VGGEEERGGRERERAESAWKCTIPSVSPYLSYYILRYVFSFIPFVLYCIVYYI
jgi:hypothetical protein